MMRQNQPNKDCEIYISFIVNYIFLYTAFYSDFNGYNIYNA